MITNKNKVMTNKNKAVTNMNNVATSNKRFVVCHSEAHTYLLPAVTGAGSKLVQGATATNRRAGVGVGVRDNDQGRICG